MTLHARHYCFLGLLVTIAASMLIKLPIDTGIRPNTQNMYDYIESLPEGSVLMVSFDHEASSIPEIRPIALSLLRHANERNIKLIGVSLLAEGTLIGYRLMQETAREYDHTYGDDWVFLGFRPQFIAAILSMGESIPQTYPRDYLGNAVDSLPMMTGIDNYDDISGVLSIADGSLTTHWIEYGGRFGVRVMGGVAAAMVTTYDPYLSSGQLSAMIGGLRGAAEYEKLIDRGGAGLRGMLAQSSAHLYVVLLVVIGNIIYFRGRKEGRG